MNLNDKIKDLELQIKQLTNIVNELTGNTEGKYIPPYSISGGITNKSLNRPADTKSCLGQITGGPVIWNTSELKIPPINEEPPNPEINPSAKGYNKHSHSRFSGGALIVDVLEFVEYIWEGITNKHSQAYWQEKPKIKKEVNSSGNAVEKIGPLDLVFDPDFSKWGAAAYQIDVEKCYLVQKEKKDKSDEGIKAGDIKKDENGNEMKSLLYNEDDDTKTSVIWDKNAKVWRFLAVYSSGENR